MPRSPAEAPAPGRVVIAGPGSALTIPGIIVTEIVHALSLRSPVTRIEVDVTEDSSVGLHRAESLTAARGAYVDDNVTVHATSSTERLRERTFAQWVDRSCDLAIAYAWPGIDNDWIRRFLRVARGAGATTVVLCASLPTTSTAKVVALSSTFAGADRVFVGDRGDADALASVYRDRGPIVEVNHALSLGGRGGASTVHEIAAFLPRDSGRALSSILNAFDAIPEAWVNDYRLHVVMRFSNDAIPEMVADSYHAERVLLVDRELSANDVESVVASSSALSVVNPTHSSRAFSAAMSSGVATIALVTNEVPEVGGGYVGGLVADLNRPASVNVALHHALRLAALRFPRPDSWEKLARRLRHVPSDPTLGSLQVATPRW